MNEPAMNPHDLTSHQSEIEQLARETHMPVDLVDQIYNIEHAKLDRSARIKTFVPVLTRRRVKARLRTQRAAS
jgi:Protein of unknown function (DUF3562)